MKEVEKQIVGDILHEDTKFNIGLHRDRIVHYAVPFYNASSGASGQVIDGDCTDYNGRYTIAAGEIVADLKHPHVAKNMTLYSDGNNLYKPLITFHKLESLKTSDIIYFMVSSHNPDSDRVNSFSSAPLPEGLYSMTSVESDSTTRSETWLNLKSNTTEVREVDGSFPSVPGDYTMCMILYKSIISEYIYTCIYDFRVSEVFHLRSPCASALLCIYS